MIIKKILNNNVVIAEGKSGKESVVMGRGLAFQKKLGDEVEVSKIEKTFVMKHMNFQKSSLSYLVRFH